MQERRKLDAPGVEVLDILPKLAKNLSWDMMVVVLLLIKGENFTILIFFCVK
jgi:hypothetical protein